LIWRNQWPKWQKLKDFLTSDESPFMSTMMNTKEDNSDRATQPSLKMKPVDKEYEERIQASFSSVQLEEKSRKELFSAGQSQFDPESMNPDEVVAKPNFNFKGLDKSNAFSKNNKDDQNKLELLLIHPKGKMFRSFAKDISLSGTFSERIIPDEFHHGLIDVVIINNFITDKEYNRLTLKSRILITDSSIYIEFVNTTETQKNSLRSMLDYYLRALKKITANGLN
jgi:hypothetical protein